MNKELNNVKTITREFVKQHPIAKLDCFVPITNRGKLVIVLYLDNNEANVKEFEMSSFSMDNLEDLYIKGMENFNKGECESARLPKTCLARLKRVFTISGDFTRPTTAPDPDPKIIRPHGKEWNNGYNEGFFDGFKMATRLSHETLERLVNEGK